MKAVVVSLKTGLQAMVPVTSMATILKLVYDSLARLVLALLKAANMATMCHYKQTA
jgi:hypothetical protein